jgi:hypothetical protein
MTYSELRQQPNRSEIVTFGKSFQDVLPAQLERLGVKKVYLIASKGLSEATSEVENIKNLLAMKSKLVGTRIGFRPHG